MPPLAPILALSPARLDAQLSEEITDLRAAPLTPVMEFLSGWAVKGPLLILLVVVAGVIARAGVRTIAVNAVTTLGALLLGSLVTNALKPLVDRPRPPFAHVGISAIGDIPMNASFPSGHAGTAFAGAAAAAVMVPALRWWVYGLAAGVALSRVYLGVHFLGDVLAGAVIGTGIGMAVALLVRRYERGGASLRPAPGSR